MTRSLFQSSPERIKSNIDFINQLKAIVGSAHVLTESASTLRYRSGFRFGNGPALAVVRPGSLLEQWMVLKTCTAWGKIIIVQAANTGLTGGSTPDGNDYDREIVIVSTLRIDRVRLISQGCQAICLSGSTLFGLEKALLPLGREPHSVIGSSCIGASVVGGICNGSGGSLIHRGPAYTELALFARIDELGVVRLVNHLGVNLGTDPEAILDALDRDAFTENADPRRLYEASGSAGKIMIFAVRVDTFPKDDRTKVFYIGSNSPSELTKIRHHILANCKDLPISGEYMHRRAFQIAEQYGKDIFLVIRLLGTKWLPTLFSFKGVFDGLMARIGIAPAHLSDKIMYTMSRMFPRHLPRRLITYHDRFEHHLMLKIPGDNVNELRHFLESHFPSSQGDFFECTGDEGEMAFLHRFAAAGAAIRFRAVHDRDVEDIVALDVALRRNDTDWFKDIACGNREVDSTYALLWTFLLQCFSPGPHSAEGPQRYRTGTQNVAAV